jgi:hypothetical protein
MKDKPTLDELFQSKKLDLPDDDFWNDFHDRVKGRAIASLSDQTKTAYAKKGLIYGALPLLLTAFIGWSVVSSFHSGGNQKFVSDTTTVIPSDDSLFRLTELIEQDGNSHREGVVQLASLSSFESFASSTVQLAGGESNFNHHSLSLSVNSGSVNQYTF